MAYDLNKLADAINDFPADGTLFSRHGKKTWKCTSHRRHHPERAASLGLSRVSRPPGCPSSFLRRDIYHPHVGRDAVPLCSHGRLTPATDQALDPVRDGLASGPLGGGGQRIPIRNPARLSGASRCSSRNARDANGKGRCRWLEPSSCLRNGISG